MNEERWVPSKVIFQKPREPVWSLKQTHDFTLKLTTLRCVVRNEQQHGCGAEVPSGEGSLPPCFVAAALADFPCSGLRPFGLMWIQRSLMLAQQQTASCWWPWRLASLVPDPATLRVTPLKPGFISSSSSWMKGCRILTHLLKMSLGSFVPVCNWPGSDSFDTCGSETCLCFNFPIRIV